MELKETSRQFWAKSESNIRSPTTFTSTTHLLIDPLEANIYGLYCFVPSNNHPNRVGAGSGGSVLLLVVW